MSRARPWLALAALGQMAPGVAIPQPADPVTAASATATASAASAPTPACPPHDAAAVLAQANALRAEGGQCGARGAAPPAPALRWLPALQALAQAQALHLAQTAEAPLQHTDAAGRGLVARAAAAGLRPARLSENLARGQADVAEVMADWAASDGHCANLRDAAVSAAGLACAVAPDGRPVWVLVLAQPRP